jgi:hypothetical protein
MITALEAKHKAFCKKPYYEIVENKINEAASNGDLVCAIRMEEITDGTIGKLYEISRFLNEFGYFTMIERNVLVISWIPSWTNHTSYVGESDSEED